MLYKLDGILNIFETYFSSLLIATIYCLIFCLLFSRFVILTFTVSNVQHILVLLLYLFKLIEIFCSFTK